MITYHGVLVLWKSFAWGMFKGEIYFVSVETDGDGGVVMTMTVM